MPGNYRGETRFDRTGGTQKARRINPVARFSVFLASLAIFTVIMTTGSFSKSSNSSKPAVARQSAQAAAVKAKNGLTRGLTLPRLLPASMLSPLPPPPPPPESIATFAVDSGGCTTTPKTDFNFGEDVCVVVSDAPLGANQRLIWGHTDGRQAREILINSATLSDILTITPTTVIAGETLDNKGTWRVEAVDTDFAPVAVTFFTIHDPVTPTADLTVYKSGPAQANENSDVSFTITVANQGPDAATDVHLADVVPSVTTFVSLTQDGAPTFSCSGSDCTIASLAKGAQVNFTAVYHTNGVSSTTVTSYTASVSSDPEVPADATAELHPADNSATGTLTINTTGTTTTCTLDCPESMNAIANTTESAVRGAHVTFASAEPSGDCGAVTASPVSGSFFPVGTTTVTVTSETNGGSCSFTITVEDQGVNPPTISCPANPPAAIANGDCEAIVTVGTPIVTGNNVTVSGVRSDGKPMYNCDCFPHNPSTDPDAPVWECDIHGTCTRRADAPFSSGITTITWIAYSHDIPGPYASPDDEEAHRTGAASCTETVTVNDVTPPVITAVDSTVSADATCQAAVPDYTNDVSDNCSCASDDNSQDCIGHQRITLTQDVPAGTLVGLGPHTIHLTANDGASSPGPDGIPETSDDGTGNVTTKTITFTVNDTTAPTVTAPADSSASADASCLAAVPNYVAGSTTADNCSSPTLTQSPAAGTMVGLGPHTVTVTSTDAAGNHSSDDVVFTVNDTTPPVVTAPADSSASADASCQAPVPNYMTGTTTSDNCGSPTLTQSPAPGTLVGKGPHTVTVTATDGSGNHSSDDVVFTVIDTTPPVISCQANIIADYNPAVNGAVVTYTPPVGTDNCSGATTMQIGGLPSGATFPTGTTTNTFKVTDLAGLTATCSFKVTVALTSLIGLDSVTLSGAAYADSYSSAGGYPATKGSLANILSNGTITMGGSSKVWGNVRSTRANVNMTGAAQVTGNATAGTTITTSGSATIGGTRTPGALAPVMTLPSVPACSPFSSNAGISGTYTYNAGTGDLTLSGVNIATLANGNYCFHNVTLGNSTQLKVNGLVVIKMTGTLNTSGASSLNNTTQIPSNLRILSSYSGSNGVVIGNSASVYAVIYAPKTSVNMSGAAPLFGTAAGKTLIIGNSGAIHYDTQLKTIWPDIWALFP